MVNIISLERGGIRQVELCPRHAMMMNTKNIQSYRAQWKEKEAGRRRGGKTISKSGQEWTLPARATENRSRWIGIIANSSVVPRRPSKVMGDINKLSRYVFFWWSEWKLNEMDIKEQR